MDTGSTSAHEVSQSKQRILGLSADISKYSDQLLRAAAKTIVKGTIYTQRKKCGNPNCRCARGELHTARILSFSHEGKTRLIPLTKYSIIEIMELERQVKSYQSFRHNRARIVHCFKGLIEEINKLESALLVEITAKKGAEHGRRKKGQEKNRPGSKESRR